MDIVNYILGNRYKGSGGYDKTTTLSWDGVLTDDEKTFGPYDFDEGQVYFYKISDEPLSSDAFRNSITTIALTKTGEIISLDAAKDHCIIGTDDELLTNICAMTLNVFIEKDMFKRGLFISKRINKSDDNDAIYVKSISYKTPIPLQNKFIPLAEDGVKGGIVGTAKTDDMLTPVGIDENGKLFAESQFYDTRDTKDLVLEFDGNLDGKEYVELSENKYYVKYSDFVPTYDSLNSMNLTVATDGNEIEQVFTKETLSYYSDNYATGYKDKTDLLLCISEGTVPIGSTQLTPGIWAAYMPTGDANIHIKKLIANYNVGELKQIDQKFIPEQKPLTFTGAVTGSYDGSEPLTVEIPSGADGSPGKDGTDGKSAYQYAVEGGYTGTETEFAAKLAQEKFANPNALTFTGAVTGTYDGSEAVTVDIPSGGGADYEFSGEILAYGTCVAGSSGPVDTGVTLADLRRYRMFLTSVAGASNVSLKNWYTKIGLLSIGRVNNNRAQSILWEFLNADKTLIMARIGAIGNHPVINRFNGDSNGYGVLHTASMPDGVVDLSGLDESTPIITYPTNASIDVNWCILGVLK